MVRVSVFGLGPVGLATAVCFAAKGYRVIGVDSDPQRVRQLKEGKLAFFEPGLKELLKQSVRSKTLQVTEDYHLNAESDFSFICVGTPSNPDGSANLNYVRSVASEIGMSLRPNKKRQVVVVKSTVIPGSARRLVKPILIRKSGRKYGKNLFLCSNPEFLREGNAIHDTRMPDRIVIGSDENSAIRMLENFYLDFHGESTRTIIKTTFENAEFIKYASNSFLATKISFINCIANIAQLTPGADVRTIATGIGLDQRIGPRFLNAGLGWGGSCFPKDLKALVSLSKSLGYDPKLIEASILTNLNQRQRAVEMCKEEMGTLMGKRLAVLGLSFKPDTDDLREAVSIPLIRKLIAEGGIVSVYDPVAMPNARRMLGGTVRYSPTAEACVKGTDCCILVTEWGEFVKLQPSFFVKRMKRPLMIDGRRIYDASKFRRAGVIIRGIGLGASS